MVFRGSFSLLPMPFSYFFFIRDFQRLEIRNQIVRKAEGKKNLSQKKLPYTFGVRQFFSIGIIR